MSFKVFSTAALAALALVGCGSPASSPANSPAPASSASAAAAPADTGIAVGVTLSDFKLSPGTLSAKAGAVEFDVKNDGPTPHNLTIKDSTGKVVGATKNLSPGENAKLTITLAAGAYTAICSLPGHESLGMKDVLTVS